MVRRYSLFSILILQFMLLPYAVAANISAYLDRSEVRMDESFTLTYEAEGSVDDEPDFSPLRLYFDILNSGKSSSMSIINGSVSRKTSWNLSLMAKQAGTFIIPAIKFGSDSSKPMTIKVLPASATPSAQNSNVYLQSEVSSSTGYVQGELIYTIRLFHAVDINNGSLSDPKLSDADAIVIKLGDDKKYQTIKNNRRFGVIERSYAIFPQQSGKLTINPIEFTGQVATQQQSFFSFGQMPFNIGNVGKTVRVFSKKSQLDIKPVPPGFTKGQWLPAESITLTEDWPKGKEIKVGDPITRTITLKANGLTASQLPKISQPDIDGLKQYPDQPVINDEQSPSGIIGQRQEKIAMIPTKAGTYELPEISIAWWNTQTNQQEIAHLPARTFKVIGGAAQSAQQVQPQTGLPKAAEQNTHAKPETSNTVPAPAVQTHSDSSVIWIVISTVLALGWLLTVLLWYLSARARRGNYPDGFNRGEQPETISVNVNYAKAELKQACLEANKQEAKDALLDWAKAIWPEKNLTSIGQIASLVSGSLKQHILTLDRVLYDPNSEKWQPATFYTDLIEFEKQLETNHKKKQDLLPKLYKVQ
jgi:hypothetical protein